MLQLSYCNIMAKTSSKLSKIRAHSMQLLLPFVTNNMLMTAHIQVLEGSSGGTSGSLLGALDRCVTAAGRRLLRAWLCRPLDDVAAIAARQDAVHDLINGIPEVAGAARKQFAGEQFWRDGFHVHRKTSYS